ncbi:hypothetical protein AVEN_143515-1 [Araneus ventricosus]|uniref:Uncharacterized protein n=1 Tax=Araneus ventricosus TaxID=182803 RepID=A0A4Y2WDF5_ARAVE|nr:hypothetical protein AVEN_143515-1 [Araneus ventricosus]
MSCPSNRSVTGLVTGTGIRDGVLFCRRNSDGERVPRVARFLPGGSKYGDKKKREVLLLREGSDDTGESERKLLKDSAVKNYLISLEY